MKVLVIGFGELYIMPYMHFYLDQLRRTDHEVHLIHWGRDGKHDLAPPEGITVHKFDVPIEEGMSRLKKLPLFWNYRQFARRIIQGGRFDRAVVLTTPPAILLYDLLQRHFPDRYVFDFRDVTFEDHWLFRKWVHGVIRHAAATFVSSDAFRVYLEGRAIHTSHNILLDALAHREVRRHQTRVADPIRIRHWGMIRHAEINRMIIRRLANDARFEVHYHGRDDESARHLREYVGSLQARNIHFHGLYKPEERYGFAAGTDLLHNIFENDKTMQPAMANKFYDGITFYVPQVCHDGSFMGQQVMKQGVGLACSPRAESFADDLHAYYHSIDWQAFEANCDRTLEGILSEYTEGIRVLDAFFRDAPAGAEAPAAS